MDRNVFYSEGTLLNKWKYFTGIILAPALCICPCSCSKAPPYKMYLNPDTDEDKWSLCALFGLFSLCQFRDSTVDSRRTCYWAVLICHFCTVIVSFCSNASKLIRPDSSRTPPHRHKVSGGEAERIWAANSNLWRHFIETCQMWVVTARAPSYLTPPLKGDGGGQRWYVCFSLGCKDAADSMPCHATIPLGGTAVTVSGRRRWCPDVTPAGALTQVLGWPLAFSTSQHHPSPSAVSRVPDRRVGSLLQFGSLSPILLQSYNAVMWTADNKQHLWRWRCWSSDPQPFQLLHPLEQSNSVCLQYLLWTVSIIIYFSLQFDKVL